jgi:hypothetical protein
MLPDTYKSDPKLAYVIAIVAKNYNELLAHTGLTTSSKISFVQPLSTRLLMKLAALYDKAHKEYRCICSPLSYLDVLIWSKKQRKYLENAIKLHAS